MKILFVSIIFMGITMSQAAGQVHKDTFSTSGGELEIWFIGHASLMIAWQDMNIHIDPFSRMGDYDLLPKADLILITHEHRDHLDTIAINAIRKVDTRIVLTPVCYDIIGEGISISNNESLTIAGIHIQSVPAYNLVHKRENGEPYHPYGRGNGYILEFGDKRIYIAGDTEDIPEMKEIKNIDIAFLPMNIPFTMTPEMTANAARMIVPRILYPYHYGQTDPHLLKQLLEDESAIEVRIRDM